MPHRKSFNSQQVPSTVLANDSIRQRFNRLDSAREHVIRRARYAAELTIPSLLPDEHHDQTDELRTPHQGLGAQGVNNLSSKLLLSLVPPGTPFFMLQMDELMVDQLNEASEQIAQATGQPAEDVRTAIEDALIKMERTILTEIDETNIRTPLFQALKMLVTLGEALMFLGDEGPMKVWAMDKYVVSRDFEGNLLEIIIREEAIPDTLDEPLRTEVKAKLAVEGKDKNMTSQGVEMFTRIWLDDTGKYVVQQEIMDIKLEQDEGSWTKDTIPYFIPRWVSINGEDYGRGKVEELIGDLRSLEVLTRAIVVGSAAAAKVVFMVDPNAGVNIRELSNAESGGFVKGDGNRINALQVDKIGDFQVAAASISKIENRLENNFLLNSSVQRNAERVTAEEIRLVAQDLEDTLGGVFSSLSQELQIPMLKRLMLRLERNGKLPKLPPDTVRPTIITGLQALGRGHDLNKLRGFVSDIAQLPQTLIYLRISELVDRIANGHGIDPEGLVKNEQEVQQELQEQQQAQILADSVPGVGTAVVKGVADAASKAASEPPE